ncbi:MAG: single-stranded-DNA-specific exonuclease RecJ [Planctomycetota bacterium]
MVIARTRTRWLDRTPNEIEPPPIPGLDPLLSRLLSARDVATAEDAERFLRPKLNHLRDPAALPGCEAAARRLARAIEQRQPVVVYGDYDVDGITASAILWHTLRQLGHEAVTTYVPHRLDEGYGLNVAALDTFAAQDRKPLVVTVDCGITAIDAAAHAAAIGLDLIVTDHHALDRDRLPDAHALVHPDLGNSPGTRGSPLCGAGVAYKLAWQTARVHCGSDRLPDATRKLLLDLLAYSALGTVADLVPLVGENRVITVFGLQRVKDTPFDGLNALIDAAELRTEKIGASAVGFRLGPRLNACGRMGHAREAVSLLTDASPVRAAELARFLCEQNDERRAVERRTLEQARARIEDGGHADDGRRVIVLADEGWHPGVLGIVASRLVETHHRPVVLLGIDPATGVAKGSGRSVEGVDLHAAMTACGRHCTKFGGHAMAAGLTLPADAIDAYRDDLIAAVNDVLPIERLAATVTIDADVSLGECGMPLFDVLQRLAPFGRSNPRPRLRLRGATVARTAERMGSFGKHLRVTLRDDAGHAVRAVGFNLGDRAEELPAGATIDAVFEPGVNEWRGVRQPELKLIDLRRTATPPAGTDTRPAAVIPGGGDFYTR